MMLMLSDIVLVLQRHKRAPVTRCPEFVWLVGSGLCLSWVFSVFLVLVFCAESLCGAEYRISTMRAPSEEIGGGKLPPIKSSER